MQDPAATVGPRTADRAPLVTFAILAYNQAQYVAAAVEAAMAQTYAPLEIIVSDDASSDGTADAIRRAVAAYQGPHQMRINVNARNLGIGAHVNAVFRMARGRIVVLAGGDDVSLPTRSLAGWHSAHHTRATLELIGDRTTVFIGVPTYRPLMEWAEDQQVALRGVRRGIDQLERPPRRPYGVGVYAGWTTGDDEWARYRSTWLPRATESPAG